MNWEKIKEIAWGVVKALPKFLLKTKLGRTILAGIIVAVLKKIGVNLPVDAITGLLDQIFGQNVVSPDVVADLILFTFGSLLVAGSVHSHVKSKKQSSVD